LERKFLPQLAAVHAATSEDESAVQVGARIKVSGTEDAVLRGMRRLFNGELVHQGSSLRLNLLWLHITVMPDCHCVGAVKELIADGGMTIASEVVNDFDEAIILAERADGEVKRVA